MYRRFLFPIYVPTWTHVEASPFPAQAAMLPTKEVYWIRFLWGILLFSPSSSRLKVLGASISVQQGNCERKVPCSAPLKGTKRVLGAALGAAAIPALPKTARKPDERETFCLRNTKNPQDSEYSSP